MKTEFTTFRVKEGKEERAKAWMEILTRRRLECVATLDREKMYYESIFLSYREGRMFLSWYSVQGEDGRDVASSEHEIDKIHLEFWHECIDLEWPPEDLTHVVSFVPEFVQKAIDKGFAS